MDFRGFSDFGTMDDFLCYDKWYFVTLPNTTQSNQNCEQHEERRRQEWFIALRGDLRF